MPPGGHGESRGESGSRDRSLVHCRGQSRPGEPLGAKRPLARAEPLGVKGCNPLQGSFRRNGIPCYTIDMGLLY